MFSKYDTTKNNKLSAQELAVALMKDMNIHLNDDEIMVIKEYFYNRYKTREITKMNFIEVMET